MFKHTFTCKICKIEHGNNRARDLCFKSHTTKPLPEKYQKMVENGKANFRRNFL